MKEARFVMNTLHKHRLQQVANSFHDSKLRGMLNTQHFPLYLYISLSASTDLVLFGVGYHHAGMDISDRKAIEAMFTSGDLPVLCKNFFTS